jgi:hypothetical protein
MVFVSLFKEKKTQPRDIIDFDVVCGDFNADNISPGKVTLSVELSHLAVYKIEPYKPLIPSVTCIKSNILLLFPHNTL